MTYRVNLMCCHPNRQFMGWCADGKALWRCWDCDDTIYVDRSTSDLWFRFYS